jgi:hypothetical protein
MPQVTKAAVSVLRSEVLHEGDPQLQRASASAVRIRPSVTDDGRQTNTLQPVAGAEPGDPSTGAENLDVFVAPELADPLDTSVLDAKPRPRAQSSSSESSRTKAERAASSRFPPLPGVGSMLKPSHQPPVERA